MIGFIDSKKARKCPRRNISMIHDDPHFETKSRCKLTESELGNSEKSLFSMESDAQFLSLSAVERPSISRCVVSTKRQTSLHSHQSSSFNAIFFSRFVVHTLMSIDYANSCRAKGKQLNDEERRMSCKYLHSSMDQYCKLGWKHQIVPAIHRHMRISPLFFPWLKFIEQVWLFFSLFRHLSYSSRIPDRLLTVLSHLTQYDDSGFLSFVFDLATRLIFELESLIRNRIKNLK